MSVTVATTALELADNLRRGRGTARVIELWRAADQEATAVSERLVLFRHAMLHAGYLTTAKGHRYKRCPMCHGVLAR